MVALSPINMFSLFSLDSLSGVINKLGHDQIEKILMNNQMYQMLLIKRRVAIYRSDIPATREPNNKFEGIPIEVIMNKTTPPFMVILKDGLNESINLSSKRYQPTREDIQKATKEYADRGGTKTVIEELPNLDTVEHQEPVKDSNIVRQSDTNVEKEDKDVSD